MADEAARTGKKLALALESGKVRGEMGAWMQRVVDFMLLKPKQQLARITAVRTPNPDVTSFDGKNAQALYDMTKELAGAAAASEEARLAERIWKIAVEGVVDDPTLGYSVFGYTVAPTRADVTNPAYFRFMTNRNQTLFHAKGFNKKQYFHAERGIQTRIPFSYGGEDFTFPAFDPRFVIVRWLSDIKASDLLAQLSPSAVEPAVVPEEAKSADMTEEPAPMKKQENKKKKKTATDPKAVITEVPAASSFPSEILAAKKARVQAAAAALSRLRANGFVEALDERSLGLAETQRLGFFPSDFAVDIAGIFGPQAGEQLWHVWPLASAILVAANPDQFALQGLHRFLSSHSSQGVNGASLRTDTLTRVVDAWSRNAVASTWDMAHLAAETFAACRVLDLLAVDKSVLFVKARALFVVAELTDRVLRVRHDATVPAGGRRCAFSGELLAEGDRATALDLALRTAAEAPRHVRVWLTTTVRHWQPTDAITAAPAKRARSVEAPESAPPPAKKSKREVAAPSPASFRGTVAAWPNVTVACDALWHAMRAQMPAQKPAALAAVRRLFTSDKAYLREWAASDAPTNYILIDIVHRFLVEKPTRALALMSDDDDDGSGNGEDGDKAERPLALAATVATFNPSTLASLVHMAKKERAMPTPCRSEACARFFETRIPDAAALASLKSDAFEWTVFAALFE